MYRPVAAGGYYNTSVLNLILYDLSCLTVQHAVPMKRSSTKSLKPQCSYLLGKNVSFPIKMKGGQLEEFEYLKE